MTTPFENIFEAQKKVVDAWSETAKKITENLVNGGKEKKDESDFWTDWLKTQATAWEDMMTKKNYEQAFANAPEQMKKWAEAQTRLARQWMDFYHENASKFGFKSPEMDRYFQSDFFTKNMKNWQEWTAKSTDRTMEMLMGKLPFSQQFHLENFKLLFESMQGHWQQMQKMMEFGITDWRGIGQFLPFEKYSEMIGRFMGFKPAKDLEEMMEQSNAMFEKYLKQLQESTDTAGEWMEKWQGLGTQLSLGQFNAIFPAAMEINQEVRDGMDKLYHLAGNGQEVKAAHVVNDLRFAYTAFLVKTAEMQMQVYEASKGVLPAAFKAFAEEMKNEEASPDFQSFFAKYINLLEASLLELMETKEYASMQGELAKSAANVKGKVDELTELAFENTPFLTNTFAKEMATENAALRKKIRAVEARLRALENADATGKKASPAKRNGRKTTAK